MFVILKTFTKAAKLSKEYFVYATENSIRYVDPIPVYHHIFSELKDRKVSMPPIHCK